MSVEKTSKKTFKSGQAWAVFLVIFLAGLALSWSANKFMPILTFVQADLHVSAQVSGWISSLFNVMGVILAFPAVGIIRKFGYRATGISALACCLIGGIISFFAPNEIILLFSRVIEGFGIGLIAVMAPALISAWFPVNKRSAPMGVWSTWQAVIIACVYLFTGNILGPDIAWKNMVLIGIVIAAVALVAFIAVVRTPAPENDFGDTDEKPVSVLEVFKNPNSWFITLLFFAFGIACISLVAWISIFWNQTVGWDTLQSNQVIGIMYAGEIVTCAVAGFVISKLKTLRIRKWFIVIFSLVYSLCFFALYHATTPGPIYAICTIYVITEGVFCAGMWYFASIIPASPSLSAPTMAMVAIGQNLGFMFGTPISGAILDATMMSGWNILAVMVTVCMLIATLSMVLLKLKNIKMNE